MAAAPKVQGKFLRFREDKGFGFVQANVADKTEIFCHVSVIEGYVANIDKNTPCEFTVQIEANGRKRIDWCNITGLPPVSAGPISKDAIMINRNLTQASGVADLLAIVSSSLPSFNLVNATTALSKLSKVPLSERREMADGAKTGASDAKNVILLLEKTAALMEEPGSACETRHVAAALAGIAKLPWLKGLGTSDRLEAIALAQAQSLLSQFKVMELSIMLWSLAKLYRGNAWQDGGDKTKKDKKKDKKKKKKDDKKDEPAPPLLYPLDLLKLGPKVLLSSLIQGLVDLSKENLRDFTPQGLANTVWALATLGYKSDEEEDGADSSSGIVSMLVTAVDKAAGQFNGQELSNTLWALAKLQVGSGKSISRLLSTASKKIKEGHEEEGGFTHQNIANAAWAISKLTADGASQASGDGDDAAIGGGAAGKKRKAGDMSSGAAGGKAAGGAQSLDFISLFGPILETHSAEFNLQELSMVVWAVANAAGDAGVVDKALLESRERCMSALSAAFQKKAFEREGFDGDKKDGSKAMAVDGDDDAAADSGSGEPDRRDCTSQQLATVAWAFAKLNIKDEDLFRGIGRRVRKLQSSCTAQDCSELAWSFAKIDAPHYKRAMVCVMEQSVALMEVRRGADSSGSKDGDHDDERDKDDDDEGGGGQGGLFSSQQLANLVWAVAKLHSGMVDESAGLVKLAAKIVKRRVSELGPRDLSNSAWAFATLNYNAKPKLWTALAKASRRCLDKLNAQECSQLLWALDKMDVKDDKLDTLLSQRHTLQFDFPTISKDPIQLTSQRAGRRLTATGGSLWEASFVLAEWLSRHDDLSSTPELESVMPHGCSSVKPGSETKTKSAGAGARQRTYDKEECKYLYTDDGDDWLTDSDQEDEPETVAEATPSSSSSSSKPFKVSSITAGVELGAGLGLVSIVAGAMGANMVSTDGNETVLELMAENGELQQGNFSNYDWKTPRCVELRWGAADPLSLVGLPAAPQLLLAADVVYGVDRTVWQALVDTIRKLSDEFTLLLIGQVQRYVQGETEFFALLEPYFDHVQLPRSCLHADYKRGNCYLHALRLKAGQSLTAGTATAAKVALEKVEDASVKYAPAGSTISKLRS